MDYKIASSPYVVELLDEGALGDNIYSATFKVLDTPTPPATPSACYDVIKSEGVNKIQLDTSEFCAEREGRPPFGGSSAHPLASRKRALFSLRDSCRGAVRRGALAHGGQFNCGRAAVLAPSAAAHATLPLWQSP